LDAKPLERKIADQLIDLSLKCRFYHSAKDAEDQLLEVSYLVLFVAVILAELALAVFVLLELNRTFSTG
jgi:hypothetical protein